MMQIQARWSLAETSEKEVALLAARCGLQPPAARVLWNRGFRTQQSVDHFLHPRLTDLTDPFLMAGMREAVARIRLAVDRKEKVLVYGDYDVDGVSSVVILSKMLEFMGHAPAYHVPDRLKDGYGMQVSVVEQAASEGVQLIISVDTGIRALDAVKAAVASGVDVIITDHHLPEEELPPAVAILNPNRPDCPYPNKNLCGAGVTLKLIQALMESLNWPPDRIVRYSDSFLVMVAIATVADVVPLTGENRIIVKRGLDGLSKTRNPGLRALLETSGVEPGSAMTATDVGFRVSPRINAAGRMDNAREVVEMFLTSDEERARAIATRLDGLNLERQRTGEAIVKAILEECGEEGPGPERAGLVFYSPDWHRGVVGIVANRVVELFHRPAIVLGRDENTGLAQGSGRSIPGFHLLDALNAMEEVFIRFGGHRQAVGITLEEARVEELKQRFNDYARQALTDEDLAPERLLDAEATIEELNDAAVDEILHLAPFGLGNRAPLFLIRGVEIRQTPEVFGKDRDHLRVRLFQGGRSLFAKAWRFAARIGELQPGTRVDVALTVEADAFSAKRGYAPWSATIRDIRPAD
ncbi:single-stranded-DNA-specific exonuclease RecJ [uncultured Paludibaculum sp.]|uniref:single-stranded-DNA-specific exonuclease RecJ n=1 Tax=uncultured Paludibaculum sp. TaxID=1765020 RepID=UPI002AAADAB0|nr:single-stranded-DNA-specific exonuclease RecJ [uncultured Paludibaculum sp.]